MGLFAAAAAVLAANQDRGEDGTFLPAGGGSHPCRVHFDEPGGLSDVGPVASWNPGVRITVYHDGLPRRPAKGDQLTVRSITYNVTAIQAHDALGFWSQCDVDEA